MTSEPVQKWNRAKGDFDPVEGPQDRAGPRALKEVEPRANPPAKPSLGEKLKAMTEDLDRRFDQMASQLEKVTPNNELLPPGGPQRRSQPSSFGRDPGPSAPEKRSLEQASSELSPSLPSSGTTRRRTRADRLYNLWCEVRRTCDEAGDADYHRGFAQVVASGLEPKPRERAKFLSLLSGEDPGLVSEILSGSAKDNPPSLPDGGKNPPGGGGSAKDNPPSSEGGSPSKRRPRGVTEEELARARKLAEDGRSILSIVRELGVPETTLRRKLKARKESTE